MENQDRSRIALAAANAAIVSIHTGHVDLSNVDLLSLQKHLDAVIFEALRNASLKK